MDSAWEIIWGFAEPHVHQYLAAKETWGMIVICYTVAQWGHLTLKPWPRLQSFWDDVKISVNVVIPLGVVIVGHPALAGGVYEGSPWFERGSYAFGIFILMHFGHKYSRSIFDFFANRGGRTGAVAEKAKKHLT